MKEALKSIFFYAKKEYEAFEEDFEKDLDKEVSVPECLAFWKKPSPQVSKEPIQTMKLKND
jgi:hypothetical protein